MTKSESFTTRKEASAMGSTSAVASTAQPPSDASAVPAARNGTSRRVVSMMTTDRAMVVPLTETPDPGPGQARVCALSPAALRRTTGRTRSLIVAPADRFELGLCGRRALRAEVAEGLCGRGHDLGKC